MRSAGVMLELNPLGRYILCSILLPPLVRRVYDTSMSLDFDDSTKSHEPLLPTQVITPSLTQPSTSSKFLTSLTSGVEQRTPSAPLLKRHGKVAFDRILRDSPLASMSTEMLKEALNNDTD